MSYVPEKRERTQTHRPATCKLRGICADLSHNTFLRLFPNPIYWIFNWHSRVSFKRTAEPSYHLNSSFWYTDFQDNTIKICYAIYAISKQSSLSVLMKDSPSDLTTFHLYGFQSHYLFWREHFFSHFRSGHDFLIWIH